MRAAGMAAVGACAAAAQVITIEVTADPGRIAGVVGAIDVRTLATKVPN